MQCSDEQNAIVCAIADNNVIVDACAGSGKTTTVLNIAARYPDKRVLLLTYNSRLRAETNQRAMRLSLTNITVHTYHSFGFTYIGKNCRTDEGLISFITNDGSLCEEGIDVVPCDEYIDENNAQGFADDECWDVPIESIPIESIPVESIPTMSIPIESSTSQDTPIMNQDILIEACDYTVNPNILDNVQPTISNLPPVPKYDIIIIDEAQDMNQYYCKLVKKILEIMPINVRICIMGDRCQSIYDFNGADSRYITLADMIYTSASMNSGSRESTYESTNVQNTVIAEKKCDHKSSWVRLNLATSYRLTIPMAEFINNCIKRDVEAPIVAVRDGPLPIYTHYSQPSIIVNEVKALFRAGFTPGDIFILAPSVKSRSDNNPIKRLANHLSASGIVIYVPNSDDCAVDDDIIEGKLVFSSFHQSKGLERKIVMVVGFDASYTKYYDKREALFVNNAVYVAITRARERLYLYHFRGNDALSYINTPLLQKYTKIVGKANIKDCESDKPNGDYTCAVTKLVTHIRSDVLSYCWGLLTVNTINPCGDIIAVPNKCKQVINGRVYYEDVSDLNGVAIPLYYDARKNAITRPLKIDGKIAAPQEVLSAVGNIAVVREIFGEMSRTGKVTSIDDVRGNNKGNNKGMVKGGGKGKVKSKVKGMGKGNDKDNTDRTNTGNNASAARIKILSLSCPLILHANDILPESNCARVLELSNIYNTMRSGLEHRLRQINSYNWLCDEVLTTATERLGKLLGGPGEKQEVSMSLRIAGINIVGSADYVDDSRLIEIKCVQELLPEHYLQCVVYSSKIIRSKNLIFNVLTGELCEITVSRENLDTILRLLVCTKYHQASRCSDTEFLRGLGVDCIIKPSLCVLSHLFA